MAAQRIISIAELTRFIKKKLEGEPLLQNVWVRGEISNFTHHSRGHMYFTMKDANSRVKCVMFASHNRKLAFLPREGTRVLACGQISVYERDGQYQFYVNEMQPDGIGNLYLAFEELKKKLEREGLFAVERKRPIPRFPKTVGVITSPTGAAVRDIMITLKRRYPGASILLYPVLVQGEQAAPSIVKALEVMNARSEADVLIVGRGGGSLEELWAFNEEMVARSIYTSAIPVISAVGHETDFTIADFVADVRAATPTAAAELAVPHMLELKQQLVSLQQRMQQGLFGLLRAGKEAHRRLRASSVLLQPQRMLQQPSERLDRLTEQLAHRMQSRSDKARETLLRKSHRLGLLHPAEEIKHLKQNRASLHKQLHAAMNSIIKTKQQVYLSSLRQLDALSPLKVMQRGYSLVYDEQENRIVKSLRDVEIGDVVKIKLTDGQMGCHVWSMEEEADE